MRRKPRGFAFVEVRTEFHVRLSLLFLVFWCGWCISEELVVCFESVCAALTRSSIGLDVDVDGCVCVCCGGDGVGVSGSVLILSIHLHVDID